MRNTILTFLGLLVVVTIFQGCAHNEKNREPTFTLREYYNMPVEDKVIEYIRFIQNEGIHNPEESIMQEMIILHGEEVVPIAVGIIATDIDSYFAERFMYILESIHLCCYDLKNERYENLLENVMENSKDEFNRSKAKIVLEEIRTSRSGMVNKSIIREIVEEALEDYEKNLNPIYKSLKLEEGN